MVSRLAHVAPASALLSAIVLAGGCAAEPAVDDARPDAAVAPRDARGPDAEAPSDLGLVSLAVDPNECDRCGEIVISALRLRR